MIRHIAERRVLYFILYSFDLDLLKGNPIEYLSKSLFNERCHYFNEQLWANRHNRLFVLYSLMSINLPSYWKHILFWIAAWFIQSVLFSGGIGIGFYLVKNIAIVLLQILLVYTNGNILFPKFLIEQKFILYAFISFILVYSTFLLSYPLIGISFYIFYPEITFAGNGSGFFFFPTNYWSILSNSAPYSLAFLLSSIYYLLPLLKLNDNSIHEDATVHLQKNEDYTVVLKEGKTIHRIDLREVYYIKGMKEYVQWHTSGRKLITLHSLTKLEDQLKEKGFLRIHKSFIINTSHIESFKTGSLEVRGKEIPIGRSYQKTVLTVIKSLSVI